MTDHPTVVIADDEKYICSLVKSLIQWQEHGLTLLGMFGNGDDVLAQFHKQAPDLLICDIEMPGTDGLGLIKTVTGRWPACRIIVISGFRNFEYAHTAMQHGVTHYLLKPIDGDELNGAIRAVMADAPQPAGVVSAVGEQAVRLGFADILLAGAPLTDGLWQINQKYHYHFAPGSFSALKIVFADEGSHPDTLPWVHSVFSEQAKPRLQDFCTEVELYRLTAVSAVAVLNYPPEERHLNSVLDKLLRGVLVDFSARTQYRFSVGVGLPAADIRQLPACVQSAERAVCARLYAPERVIYYADPARPAARPFELEAAGRMELDACLEAIDLPRLERWINGSFLAYDKQFRHAPEQAFAFCRRVTEAAALRFDALDIPVADKTAFARNASTVFEGCSSADALRRALFRVVEEEVTARLSQRQQNSVAYVQQAKQWIAWHYAEDVTLEVLAEKLHISPVYLSILFKNVTGMNFSKYLTSVRMERAKELLKHCDMNLGQIAGAVGYDSANYFSSVFRRVTGLKPSEYRRLHQHELGE